MANQDAEMNEIHEIHVCFSTDNNYAPYCGVAILSMFQNKNPEDRICVYILHRDLTAENIEKLKSLEVQGECQIKTLQICEKHFDDMPLLPNVHLTIETYYRFIIPRIFPNVDKMLYLDCDIIVKKSLWGLYDMDMQEFLVSMVRDIGVEGYNAGVMMINCRRWRMEKIESALYEYAEKNKDKICLADQEIINGQLAGRILEIDKKWNRQVGLHLTDDIQLKDIIEDKDICIIHYLGMSKPWESVFQNVLVDECFEYIKQIPWDLPDKRDMYKGFMWYKYYLTRQNVRAYFKQGKIRGDEKVLILYETAEHIEVECAAKDLGIKNIKGYLIKSDDWKQEEWDLLIIEFHNIAIVDYILRGQGYDMEEEPDRRILVSETSHKIDDDLLIKEYFEYVKQSEAAGS